MTSRRVTGDHVTVTLKCSFDLMTPLASAIVGNDVSDHNTSCVRGFLIPQFNAPTNVPGVGIPIVTGLSTKDGKPAILFHVQPAIAGAFSSVP